MEQDVGVGFQIVGNDGPGRFDGLRREGVSMEGTLLQRKPVANFSHEIVAHADRCHGHHFLPPLVDQAYPYHAEAARIGRNAAGLLKDLIAVTRPHYESVDSAQHGVYSI